MRAKLRENSVEKARSMVSSLKKLTRLSQKSNRQNWKDVAQGQRKDASTLSKLLNI